MSRFPGYKDLDEYQKAAIDWQYRIYGDFFTSLFGAIKLADETNLDRIALGFPVEVGAYRRFSREEGWWEEAERVAFGKGKEEVFDG